MDSTGYAHRPNIMAVWLAVSVPLSMIVGVTLAMWARDAFIEHHWREAVDVCVVEMQSRELGHSMGGDPCGALSEDEKREAAYRWAQRRGAL